MHPVKRDGLLRPIDSSEEERDRLTRTNGKWHGDVPLNQWSILLADSSAQTVAFQAAM